MENSSRVHVLSCLLEDKIAFEHISQDRCMRFLRRAYKTYGPKGEERKYVYDESTALRHAASS